MSKQYDIASDTRIMNDGYLNGDLQSMNMGRASVIGLPTLDGNFNFHVMSLIIQPLQMKDLFGGLAHEDPHEHLRNFVDVYELFTFRGVTQEAIRLRVFPFSLAGEIFHWLVEFPHHSITSWV